MKFIKDYLIMRERLKKPQNLIIEEKTWSGRLDRNKNKIYLNDVVMMEFSGMGDYWRHKYLVKIDDKGFYFDEEGKRISIDRWDSSSLTKITELSKYD
tara:strand:- start:4178 stop:4471 length:294 start_codon:yes stop_codon:yes gene_type:complete